MGLKEKIKKKIETKKPEELKDLPPVDAELQSNEEKVEDKGQEFVLRGDSTETNILLYQQNEYLKILISKMDDLIKEIKEE